MNQFGIRGIQHLGIPTASMEQSVAFYKSLGFEEEHRADPVKVPFGIVFLKCGSLVIELYENPAAAVQQRGAINHVALDVQDIEAAFQTAKERGLSLLDEEIQALPVYAGVRFFTVEGPNGERIEFNEKKIHTGE